MFSLTIVTCVLSFMCDTEVPDMTYISADRCHQQAAIIAGIQEARLPRAAGDLAPSWTATCTDLETNAVSTSSGGTDPEVLKAATLQFFELN